MEDWRTSNSEKLQTAWAMWENVFPLNKMAADESKLPAAMFLISACGLQKVWWLFAHIIFTESLLPLVVSFDSQMTGPHVEQNVRSTLRLEDKEFAFVMFFWF